MEFTNKDCVVYTSLIGEHEGLNSQKYIKDSNLRHICFTDDRNLTSIDWEIIHVDKIFPCDFYRSQRNLKVRPHLILPQYKYSLYIDNTVLLKRRSEEFIEMIINNQNLKEDEPFFCLPYHSQFNLINEFNACLNNNLDDRTRIYEQLNDYIQSYVLGLKQKAYWGAILFRSHNHHEIKKLSEIWFAHVCRYSRRDQLSIIHSSKQTHIDLKGFSLKNSNSEFHKWPVTNNIRKNREYQNNNLEFIPYEILEGLNKKINYKDIQISELKDKLNRINKLNPISILFIILKKTKKILNNFR